MDYMAMQESRDFLASLDLPRGEAYDLPTSTKRFPDGAHWRMEIPTVEGPRVFEATLEEAQKQGIPVHRVSQGSGAMLLTEDEIREMADMGASEGVEVSLFVGPRGVWDIHAGSHTVEGKVMAYRLRGVEQLVYAMEDLQKMARNGIRSALLADEGLIYVANEMKKAGKLPADFILKVSIRMSHGNPAAVRIVEQLGANTFNVVGDLSVPNLAGLRQSVDMPIDLYAELSDGFGGMARYYELPDIVRTTAPIYIKCGTMNATKLYPSGKHLEETAIRHTRERVHRGRIVKETMERYAPELMLSKPGLSDPGVPVVDR